MAHMAGMIPRMTRFRRVNLTSTISIHGALAGASFGGDNEHRARWGYADTPLESNMSHAPCSPFAS